MQILLKLPFKLLTFSDLKSQFPLDTLKIIREVIIICLIQDFEADFQPQILEFRINPENFHPYGKFLAKCIN